MKAAVNVICVIAIAALLAFPYINIELPPVDKGSPIADAFVMSLATDLESIADAVGDKSPAEVDAAIENAFKRATDEADRELDKSIQNLADDDYERLKEVLRGAAGELQ